MGWQLGFLEAVEDSEITQQEVTGLVTEVVSAAMQGMVIVGVMTVFVKMFYGILGPKKFAKQEEEVLEMVKEIW